MKLWAIAAVLAHALLVSQAAAATLVIEAELHSSGELWVRYRPPPGTRDLPFWQGSEQGRQRWRSTMARAGDDCTELLPSALRLRPGCTQALLLITPRLLAAYATYEPAQPLLDGQGVLSHTGHYAVVLPGTHIDWQWLAPPGGTVLRHGTVHRTQARWRTPADVVDRLIREPLLPPPRDSGLNDMVFTGTAQVHDETVAWAVVDSTLPADSRRQLSRGVAHAIQDYTQAFGRALPKRATLLVTAAEQPGQQGDTADGWTMRLRLPRTGVPSDTALALFIAHEAAHWWNAGLFQSDPAQAWLHEGHAEWLAHWQVLERGPFTRRQWLQRLESQINLCLLEWGDRPWASQAGPRRGGADYSCGMAVLLLAQARHGGGMRALAGLHSHDGPLDTARVVAWGGPAVDLGPLLQDRRLAFDAGLVERLRRLGWADAVQAQDDSDIDQGFRRTVSARLVQRLMRADCDGNVGLWTLASGFRLDPAVTSCKRLRVDQELQTVQGLSLAERPLAAWSAMREICATRGTLTLGYAGDVRDAWPCPASLTDLPEAPRPWQARLQQQALFDWLDAGSRPVAR